jgi:16S rRNA (guanine527-N7)-methyltransferase
MTEDEARDWLASRFDPKRVAHVERFLAMVIEETTAQNLIAPSTIETIWTRHAVDSAQLLALGNDEGVWVDVGTGGGFPGVVIAILRDAPITLVEPRKRRAAFLEHVVTTLGLSHTTVIAAKVEQIAATAEVISARAVASVEKLLQATAHCATPETRWILPRGRLDPEELALLQRQQRGMMFHVEHSITDAGSVIIVAGSKR